MNNEIPKYRNGYPMRSNFGETEKATHPLQTNSNRIHVYLGTPKTLTIHTKQTLFVGDTFPLKNRLLRVTEILADEKSKAYGKLFRFYELRFELI